MCYTYYAPYTSKALWLIGGVSTSVAAIYNIASFVWPEISIYRAQKQKQVQIFVREQSFKMFFGDSQKTEEEQRNIEQKEEETEFIKLDKKLNEISKKLDAFSKR